MRAGRAGRLLPPQASRLAIRAAVVLVGAAVLAGCNMSGPPGVKTKFSEREYGAASPRKVAWNKPVPKGGGYYTVGKPYEVAGQWFHPAEDPDYKAVGVASWYGPNFHGRQTANGEVYDMASLSAAHPTLPLPSYVRVTNLNNGRSVVVRVNDRGPFSRGRLIDVSARAADMLGFRDKGVAKVEVEYVGRARMDGQDEQLLMASYQGPGAPSVGGIGDEHIMLASMPTPQNRPLPSGIATDGYAFASGSARSSPYEVRPSRAMAANDPIGRWLLSPRSSYAEPARLTPAQQATADLARAGTAAAVAMSAAPDLTEALGRRVSVQIGVFGDRANAEGTAARLAGYGVASIAESGQDQPLYVLRLTIDGSRVDPAAVVAAAEAAGAKGAYVLSR